MPVEPLKPTRADLSNDAATAGHDDDIPGASVHRIDHASSANAVPDNSTVAGIGDTLFGAKVSAGLTGGVELTILPHEEPTDTYRVFKLSPQLSPVLDAINVNVYSAGYTFDAIIEADRPDARERVRQSLQFKAALTAGNYELSTKVTEAAIDRELKRIKTRSENESQFARAWLARACPGSTFHATVQLLGYDMEIQGDGYLEVLRDYNGYPSKLIWAPAWSIRAKPIGHELVQLRMPVQITDFDWDFEIQQVRYRSFVQVDLNGVIIARYKQYGDPRVMSRKTGAYYPTLEAMRLNEDEWDKDDRGNLVYPPIPATELLQFSLPNPLSSAYGKPGYTGIYPVLDGARDLEEENRVIITDRKVPQMMILIAGGAGVPQKDLDAFYAAIDQNQKEGKKSIYVLQARSAKYATGALSPTPTIEIVKTKSEQYQDALGLKYLEHGERQVGHAYRLPPAARGQHEGIDKDDAQEGYRFAETQVYDPKRDNFDDRFNSTLIRDLGIQLVKYRSLSRVPREPSALASIINVLMNAGVLTPDEGRQLAGDIFHKDFRDLAGIWSKLPTKLLTAMLQTKNQLVAAALLGSESESDIIERLQAALVGQLDSAQGQKPEAPKPPEGQEQPKPDKPGSSEEEEKDGKADPAEK